MFFEEHHAAIASFVSMSQTLGSRADYVQGGGGNTSVKTGDGSMAIKASGFCLKDITEKNAYAVLNGDAIRRFYLENDPARFDDVESAGAACVKENSIPVEGMDSFRPSVEAGFHSILKTYVAHTHSVYANMATCSTACREIAKEALAGADYLYGWVDYTDPGARLTFAVRDEIRRVQSEQGKVPAVILMQNHGIIVHDDDADTCVRIHADANERLAGAFGVSGNDFPPVSVRETENGMYEADVPFLREQLKDCEWSYDFLMKSPLYPDQMVFFADTFYMNEPDIREGTCSADTTTGRFILNTDRKKALVLTETLTAVLYVLSHIRSAGYRVSTMGADAQSFIAGWESEKYRKSLANRP